MARNCDPSHALPLKAVGSGDIADVLRLTGRALRSTADDHVLGHVLAGCAVFVMLTGKLPSERTGDTPEALRRLGEQVPWRLRAAIPSCTATSRHRRSRLGQEAPPLVCHFAELPGRRLR